MFRHSVAQIPKDVQDFLTYTPILVTGGNGFLGKHVVKILRRFGANVMIVDSNEYDLRDWDDARDACRTFTRYHCTVRDVTPAIIHLAAKVSGIHSTSAYPFEHLVDNVKMATNIVNSAAEFGIHYIVAAGSVCAYPENCPVPMHEENFWNGKPEPTNFSYGMAKRYVWAVLDAAKRERLIKNYAYLISANLYGPGDNFDPRTSHVIPALIHNAAIAQETDSTLEVWGTGGATRDFLYVWDAALAYVMPLLHMMIHPMDSFFVNIGTGSEMPIDYLAKLICELMGVDKGIIYDRDKPDGQKRRQLNIERAKTMLKWTPETEIKTGLENTIRYYNEHIRTYERQVS